MEIGIVKIEYTKSGDLTSASFHPTLEISADEKLLTSLSSIPNEDQESIAKQANIVFSTWFNEINHIELADRSEFQIINKVVECEKYSTGEMKKCVIKFSFEPLTHLN